MLIVITGCGWVTPRAAGEIETVLQAYASRKAEKHPPPRYEPIGPQILSQFTNLPGEAAKENAVRLAAVALEIAWKQAGLSASSYSSDRKGLVLGCALAGVTGMIDFANDVRKESPRFVSPIHFPQTVGNYICGALARGYDFRGPASTIACGSASSLEAIWEGCALLSSNQADVVIAGGTELLSPEIVEALNLPDVNFADGACLLVLEREDAARQRGAIVLASVPECDTTKEAQPDPAQRSVSVAGHFVPGAICIEKWTGRTLGADGTAAICAAMGTRLGVAVPCFGLTPSDGIGDARFPGTRSATVRQTILGRATGLSGEIHELPIVWD